MKLFFILIASIGVTALPLSTKAKTCDRSDVKIEQTIKKDPLSGGFSKDSHKWLYETLGHVFHKALTPYIHQDIFFHMMTECHKSEKSSNKSSCIEIPLFFLKKFSFSLENFNSQKLLVKIKVKPKDIDEMKLNIINLSLINSSTLNPKEKHFVIDFSINFFSFNFELSVSDLSEKEIFYQTETTKASFVKINMPLRSKIIIKFKESEENENFIYSTLDKNGIDFELFYNLEDVLQEYQENNSSSVIEFQNHPKILPDDSFLNLISFLFKEKTGMSLCEDKVCKNPSLFTRVKLLFIDLYTYFKSEESYRIEHAFSDELTHINYQFQSTIKAFHDNLRNSTNTSFIFSLKETEEEVHIKVNQCGASKREDVR